MRPEQRTRCVVVARSVIRFDLKQLRQACSRCSLAELAAEIPSLQRQLLRLMSKDIVGSQALTGDFTAQERMAAFVLSLSRRLQQRGYSPHEFLLAMTRRDIANFLRLATETVSRTLAEFQEQGLIAVERRNLRILDLRRLTALARNVPLI